MAESMVSVEFMRSRRWHTGLLRSHPRRDLSQSLEARDQRRTIRVFICHSMIASAFSYGYLMVVKLLWIGHRVTGLYDGVKNVRRYFPRDTEAIDLELDHLRIQCELKPCFWMRRPEIHDSRLCEWLKLKHLQGKGFRSMTMIPSGERSFILLPAGDVELSYAIGRNGGPGSQGEEDLVVENGKTSKRRKRSWDALSNLG
jgi:hypothetical protein